MLQSLDKIDAEKLFPLELVVIIWWGQPFKTKKKTSLDGLWIFRTPYTRRAVVLNHWEYIISQFVDIKEIEEDGNSTMSSHVDVDQPISYRMWMGLEDRLLTPVPICYDK